MDDDKRTAILRRMSEGADFKAACAKIGISRQTGYRARKADPGFDAQVKRLQDGQRPTKEEYGFETRNRREAARQEGARHIERPELQWPESEKKLSEYHEGEIQYESRVHMSSDLDFKPGFQPEWRAHDLDMRLRMEQERKRRASYHPLDGPRRR